MKSVISLVADVPVDAQLDVLYLFYHDKMDVSSLDTTTFGFFYQLSLKNYLNAKMLILYPLNFQNEGTSGVLVSDWHVMFNNIHITHDLEDELFKVKQRQYPM